MTLFQVHIVSAGIIASWQKTNGVFWVKCLYLMLQAINP